MAYACSILNSKILSFSLDVEIRNMEKVVIMHMHEMIMPPSFSILALSYKPVICSQKPTTGLTVVLYIPEPFRFRKLTGVGPRLATIQHRSLPESESNWTPF